MSPSRFNPKANSRAARIGPMGGELGALRERGVNKTGGVLASPRGGVVRAGARDVTNLGANNSRGLATPRGGGAAARGAIGGRGSGRAWVRFFCGTQTSHKALEE